MLTNKQIVLSAFAAKNEQSLDAHCHIHWSQHEDKVSDLNDFGIFINTVSPNEFEEVSSKIEETKHVKIGLGLHPWYVEDCDFELFEELLPKTRFVGEIGLDFSKKFTEVEKKRQEMTFTQACNVVSDLPFSAMGSDPNLPRIVSVHTCKTQGKTHDILRTTGVLEKAIVIYHWFGDDACVLRKAIDDKCLFSVSERMLASKKGAEFAKMIPEEQILFETDMPKRKGDVWTAKDSQQSIIFAWQKWMKMVNATSR